MKFIYPAVFSKTDDGSYQGYFPDLECCYAKGDTLEDAVDDANEAAYNWISTEEAVVLSATASSPYDVYIFTITTNPNHHFSPLIILNEHI